MVVPILGSMLMILIAGAAPRKNLSLRRVAVWSLLLCMIWLVAVNFAAPLERSFHDAATNRVVKFADEAFRQKVKSLGKYVLVIEGSSATSRAVDGELLESELRAVGIAASVVQVSLDGANHVERLQILRQFLRGLDAAEIAALKRSRVILCQEVEYTYDRDPFDKLENNAFTDRTLEYINLQNFPEIVRWFALRSNWTGLLKKRELVGSVLAMECFNLFRVGYLERVERGGVQPPQSGFSPKEARREDFNPTGPLPLSFPYDPSKTDLKEYQSLRPWVSARDAEYAGLFAQFDVTQCFFSVTSWSSSLYRYNRWWSESAKTRPFFSGDEESLRQSLTNPDLWSDDVHLKPAGARIFTQALASYFIDAITNHQL